VVILLLKGLVPTYEKDFTQLGAKVKWVDPIPGPKGLSFAIPHYQHVYAKFHLWELTEYDQVMYLDADCLVVNNPHSAFEKCQGFCAVRDEYIHKTHANRGLSSYFNVGVMVIKPSLDVYKEMIKRVSALKANPKFPEQDLLNDYYDKKWTSLGYEFNAINDERQDFGSLMIIHLTGKVWKMKHTAAYKYWNQIGTTTSNKVEILGFTKRDQIPFFLEKAGFKVGAELGVQQGLFAEHILKHWPSCTTFYLIDIWAQQKNYIDGANVGDREQDLVYQKALNRMAPFRNKRIILRNFTKDAAKLIPDLSLDFVYVDARHDYCGVMEDLTSYYPKLKPGGYMAGHDYKTAAEVRIMDRSQDWGICGDGTRNEGSVKGAVDEFMKKLGIKKLYLTDEAWTTWMFIKQ
jgi:hypothetical protein